MLLNVKWQGQVLKIMAVSKRGTAFWSKLRREIVKWSEILAELLVLVTFPSSPNQPFWACGTEQWCPLSCPGVWNTQGETFPLCYWALLFQSLLWSRRALRTWWSSAQKQKSCQSVFFCNTRQSISVKTNHDFSWSVLFCGFAENKT